MKKAPAQIFPVAAPGGAFRWAWRCSCHKRSGTTFVYFYDCVEDARRSGCSVDLQQRAAGVVVSYRLEGGDRA